MKKLHCLFFACLALQATLLLSCEKQEIQFGSDLPESYSRIISLDTVTPVISMFVVDSFPTSGNSIIFAGRYKDGQAGTTTTRSFFQFGLPNPIPSSPLADDAIFDSMVVVLHPKADFYGDSTKPMTYSLYELDEQPEYTYQTYLYNTSSVLTKPTPLASLRKSIRPSLDSLHFRLPDSKGKEFFDKINNQGTEFTEESNFLSYFKGLSLRVAADDLGAIYSFPTDSSTRMRLHYHTTIPYYTEQVLEFYLTRTGYQFNQVLTDRTGTMLEPTYSRQQEFPSTEAQPIGLTQSGTGVLMKINFPTLQEILTLGKTLRLLSAELELRPVEGTFEYTGSGLQLPSLFLAQTDATNNIGYALVGADGSSALTGTPIIDDIYRINTYYSFNLTSYISYLLTNSNAANLGLFVMQEYPGSTTSFKRAFIGSHLQSQYKTRLKLTVLTTTQ
ncbi:MAG: DUF4270 family protein [Candidatus Pseudobacter hemicellulosilyticus]|uniref:DUF4270 family protein n=1 Tax=Candidatus Pseudobacter hemicellulosilyticus TaxID=3121375 RepID=A0AAJ5WQJ8_9BACT|nr:MAG: DUF4270 family protein [Pseudobacter sp.]